MLEVEIGPGSGIGPWLLGAPIGEALALVARQQRLIPRAVVAHQDGTSPVADVALHLPDNGLLFRFEPHTQRLRCIEVTDVSRVRLTYHGAVVSAPDVPATFQLVYSRFGPSVPGDYQAASRLYLLSYPGLALAFPIPERYHRLYAAANDLPLELPDGSSPLLERLVVFQGASLRTAALAPLPAASLYGEPVRGVLHQGVVFERRAAALDFGAANQDVQALLGPPARVFFKHEERLRIHAAPAPRPPAPAHAHAHARPAGSDSDYFLNYFALGIDALVDGASHTLKKLVLHSNSPAHPDFSQYAKCFWRLQLPNSDAVIDSTSTWEEVQAIMGSAGKPLVYSKGGNASPFGASLFYAYDGVIFEVLRSGPIATVTLFRPAAPPRP